MANETDRRLTVGQLQSVVDALCTANDARFRNSTTPIAKVDLASALQTEIEGKADASDLGSLAALSEVGTSNLSSSLQSTISGKADSSTTISGYGITDAYTKTEIDSKLSSVYKPGGSKTASELTSSLLVAANEGKVYNLSDALTLTSSNKALFVENAENSYPAGTNFVVIDTDTTGSSPSYKFDVLAGFVDLSGYATTSDVEVATAAQITAIINGLYSED